MRFKEEANKKMKEERSNPPKRNEGIIKEKNERRKKQ